ncbi:MAG: hypothetical protein KUG82_20265 [Pseudomonadales bacterium]|nr:hypothetical protein [Pseudomonadales bacterium]
MGAAVIIFYLPLYLFFSIISIVSVRSIIKNRVEPESTDKCIIKYKIMGFIIAIIFTWTLIWLVPTIGNMTYRTDFEEQFIEPVLQLGLTLIAPIILVLITRIFFFKKRGEKYFSVGALLSTLVMPWITFLVL